MSPQFFTTVDYFKARYDAVGRRMAFRAKTLDQWRIWRDELRGILRECLGIDHLISTPPNPRITECVQREGYTRERVEIDTEPGVTMPFYVLIPDGAKPPFAPVIAAHGHCSGGKVSPSGCTEFPGVAEAVRDYDYDYGVQAARHGYMVFCPDARGFGERRESYHQKDNQFFESSCDQLMNTGLPLGISVAGMWVWDLMRLVDYAQSRPETQGQKVGAIGLSGGGLQTLYLAALDDRIACAIVSGYFYGVKDSLIHMSCCFCNYIPHAWENVDHGDLGALIAPRPVLIESGTKDDLNGPRGVINCIEQVDIARQAYGLLGVPERIEHDIFEGLHKWHGTMANAWLDRWLRA